MDFSELIAAADPSIFTESIKAWVSGLNINSVIMLIMMIFMIVGAIDRIRGNKLGYGEKFEDGFNAIGSCVKKEYTYLIYNSGIRDPFYVNRAWFYPKHLDETVMQRAADCFIGTHDFAAVRSVGTDVKSTVRTVYDYKVERDGDLISLRVSANGFLYNMARAMAGTCVYAAEGKFPPEAVAQILLNGDRTAAGPTVPPGGLYMTQLWYDDGKAVFHVG